MRSEQGLVVCDSEVSCTGWNYLNF